MIINNPAKPAAKGTIGYRAHVWRKSHTANNFESHYLPTAAEAIGHTLYRIESAGGRARVKGSDVISCSQWTATGDGGWQTNLSLLSDNSQRVTVEHARAAAYLPAAV